MSRKILVLMGWLSLTLCLAGGSTAWAMIPKTPTGALCLHCHEIATPTPGDPANWTLRSEYQGEAGCITCHSHATSSTTYIINPGGSPEITVPVTVYTGATEPTEFLASGNFWWVKGPADGIPGSPNNWTGGNVDGTNDAGGHNIFPGEVDERYTLEGVSVAPGHSSGCLNETSCHSNLNTADNTFGNRQSCLKCHMMMKGTDYPAGFHHADDSGLVVGMGRNVPGDPGFDGYYRYLTGHMSGEGHGVAGIEDDDWEATVSSTDHNEYLGLQGALNSPGGFRKGVDHHTSTAFCSGCHGNFHVASEYATGKPEGGQDYEWLRHPVEMVLPDDEGSDFHLYTKYNPNVPLGRPDLTFFTGPSDIVTPGTDVINCLSCHRSHGTPGGSHLRWDPTQWNACATCHLTKRSSIEGQYICDAIDDCNDCHTSHGRSLRFQYEESPGVFRAEDEFGGDHDNKALVWMKMDFYGPVEHTTDEVLFPIPGDSPYVLGVEPYNGICEVCHTGTLYWKDDGTGAPHYGGPGAEEQCGACHLHEHDWLGDMPDDAAHNVHNGALGRGPDEMDCSVCHGKGDTIGEMADAGACDPCHSRGGAFNGVNDPVIGVKFNWPDAVYEAGGTALKPGKQDWCAGCHDDGSSIIGGVAAPNVMGDSLNYGFKVSGHGRPSAGKNCGDCHDFARRHIDGQARTYVAAPLTYNYRDGYRLIENMAIPRTTGQVGEDAFKLCYKGCHHVYSRQFSSETMFRDDNKAVSSYHTLHLDEARSHVICWDSDWDGEADSAMSCTACHNVHGSPMEVGGVLKPDPVMIRHGELISTPGTDDKVPALDFHWYDYGGLPVVFLAQSRQGGLLSGLGQDISYNHVCWGACHDHGAPPAAGEIIYSRRPSSLASYLAVVQEQLSGKQGLYVYSIPTQVDGTAEPAIATDRNFGNSNWGSNIIAMACADTDGDGIDEVAVIRQRPGGMQRLEIYNPPVDVVGDTGALLASDLSFGNLNTDKNNIAMAAVDVDGDGIDEIAVVRQKQMGRQSLFIFNAPQVVGGQTEPAIASDSSFGHANMGNNIIAMTGVDVNGDGVDEIGVIMQRASGRQRLEIYNTPQVLGGETGDPIASDLTFGDSMTNQKNVALTSVDENGDGTDEIAVVRHKSSGRQRIEVYNAPQSVDGETGLPIATDVTFGTAGTDRNTRFISGMKF